MLFCVTISICFFYIMYDKIRVQKEEVRIKEIAKEHVKRAEDGTKVLESKLDRMPFKLGIRKSCKTDVLCMYENEKEKSVQFICKIYVKPI